MDLYVLFGRYMDGRDDFVEALAVQDELSHDANPDYIWDEFKKRKASGTYTDVRVFRLPISASVTSFIDQNLSAHQVDAPETAVTTAEAIEPPEGL